MYGLFNCRIVCVVVHSSAYVDCKISLTDEGLCVVDFIWSI